MSERTTSLETAEEFNAAHPIGTRVLAFPGSREGRAILTTTRSEAWGLGSGDPVVMVEGYAGGIGLTHIEVMPDAPAPEATDPTPGEVGLSQAEREVLREAIADGRVADSIAQHGPPKDHALLHRVLRAECARFVRHATPAVERILAARTADLHAEVEALRREIDESDLRNITLAGFVQQHFDRAEAAEAREAELRATVERVEALADAADTHTAEANATYDPLLRRYSSVRSIVMTDDIRAALTTPPTTEGGK